MLVAPEMPIVAPRIGEDTVEVGPERLAYRLALIPFNSPWSCLGLPVASVPCGGLVDGLPVGMAVVGRRYDEGAVLRVATRSSRRRTGTSGCRQVSLDAMSLDFVYTTQSR